MHYRDAEIGPEANLSDRGYLRPDSAQKVSPALLFMMSMKLCRVLFFTLACLLCSILEACREAALVDNVHGLPLAAIVDIDPKTS